MRPLFKLSLKRHIGDGKPDNIHAHIDAAIAQSSNRCFRAAIACFLSIRKQDDNLLTRRYCEIVRHRLQRLGDGDVGVSLRSNILDDGPDCCPVERLQRHYQIGAARIITFPVAEDLEREKRAAIAVLKQQLVNLLDLYKNAVISAEEYYRDKQDRERQITFWEARTTDIQKKSVELERVMAAFSQVLDLWGSADSDGGTLLARGLFQYIVFDLDKQQIVDFRLHPWADQYLMLRADLYGGDDGAAVDSLDDENDKFEGKENRFATGSSDEAVVSPTGVGTAPLPTLNIAPRRLLDRLYWGSPIPQKPITEKHIPKAERNDRICELYAEGETLESISSDFGLSVQRVHQIICRRHT